MKALAIAAVLAALTVLAIGTSRAAAAPGPPDGPLFGPIQGFDAPGDGLSGEPVLAGDQASGVHMVYYDDGFIWHRGAASVGEEMTAPENVSRGTGIWIDTPSPTYDIAVDGSRVYVVWVRADGDVFFAMSDNGGRGFGPSSG